MTTSSTVPANTATGAPETPKPSAPPAQSSAPVTQPVKKQVNPFEGDSRYAQFQVVNMRLLKEGIIQYDPSYPELQLNTTAKEGMPLPLTPFFASRINQTLELVL